MNVMALGTQQALNRLAGLTTAANIEMVTVTEMSRALESLSKTQFDVIVLGGLNGTTSTVYHAVRRITPAPVVLLVDRSHMDWNAVNLLDIAGYIAEQVGPVELLARLQAIHRRSLLKEEPAR